MDKLLRQSLSHALETGADLLNILTLIMDNAEYEDDRVVLDTEIMDEAKQMLCDMTPEPAASTTLH